MIFRSQGYFKEMFHGNESNPSIFDYIQHGANKPVSANVLSFIDPFGLAAPFNLESFVHRALYALLYSYYV